MTKAELIERIVRSRDVPADITKKEVALILGVAFDELATYFAKAKVTRSSSPRFTFPRFGTFTKKKRSARRGVNPRTLEPMEIGACDTIDFKACRELREQMNGTGTVAKGSDAETKRGRSTAARKRKKAARSGKRAKDPVKRTAGPNGGRKLTPRDEDAELDALIDDDALFEEAELPVPPMQRVKRRRSNSAVAAS